MTSLLIGGVLENLINQKYGQEVNQSTQNKKWTDQLLPNGTGGLL